MGYAKLSGHLAARARLVGTPELYDRLWKDRLSGLVRTATVNRYAHDRLGGNLANPLLARRPARAADPRECLRKRHVPNRYGDLLQQLAQRRVGRAEDPSSCLDGECNCTCSRCHGRGISEHGHRPGE